MDEREQPHAEIVFMGEAKVGKTSLIRRIIRHTNSTTWDSHYEPTVEDSYVREFIVEDYLCRLRLIDTAGSYVFPAMHRLWLKRASAFVLVCSRNDSHSLERIKTIVQQIQEERQHDYKNLIILLCVNKNDIPIYEWKLNDEEIEQTADQLEIPINCIITTSARDNSGIIQMLKIMWEQNLQAGENQILFSPLTSYSIESFTKSNRRRVSAFAILFTSPSRNQSMIHYKTKFNANHRLSYIPINKSKSPPDSETLQGKIKINNFLIKKFGRLSLGGHRPNFFSDDKQENRTHDYHNNNIKNKYNNIPTVIKMECNIS